MLGQAASAPRSHLVKLIRKNSDGFFRPCDSADSASLWPSLNPVLLWIPLSFNTHFTPLFFPSFFPFFNFRFFRLLSLPPLPSIFSWAGSPGERGGEQYQRASLILCLCPSSPSLLLCPTARPLSPPPPLFSPGLPRLGSLCSSTRRDGECKQCSYFDSTKSGGEREKGSDWFQKEGTKVGGDLLSPLQNKRNGRKLNCLHTKRDIQHLLPSKLIFFCFLFFWFGDFWNSNLEWCVQKASDELPEWIPVERGLPRGRWLECWCRPPEL